MIVVGVALAGSVGAVVRFVIDSALRARSGSSLPWPTVLINVTGSLLLGLLTGAVLFHDAPAEMLTIVGVGFCGGFTTFSTFSLESALMIERGELGSAAAYIAGSVVVSILALFAGLHLIRTVS